MIFKEVINQPFTVLHLLIILEHISKSKGFIAESFSIA